MDILANRHFLFIYLPKAFPLKGASDMEHIHCLFFERLAYSMQPKTPNPTVISSITNILLTFNTAFRSEIGSILSLCNQQFPVIQNWTIENGSIVPQSLHSNF